MRFRRLFPSHRAPVTLLALLATVSLSLLGPPPAEAVGTRTFELSSLDDLSGGDLKGTSVDSLGHVRAGFNLGNVALSEASSVWSVLVQPDGAVLLGTGTAGKVLRVARGQASVFADTGQLAVTSLVRGFGDALFAGTIPNGKVLKIDSNGKATTFAELKGADHVWALAFDKKRNALFAATGPEGKLFRIDASGQAQVFFDADEPHLVCLALDESGGIYAGTSGSARIYRVVQAGRASVLHDFGVDEVKAIALGPKGTLFAIANDYPELPEVPKRSSGTSPASPSSAARPKPGKGVLVRFDSQGVPERLFRRDDTHFTSLAIGDDGLAYVGTGVDGRVYAIDDAHTSVLVADTDERQVGAMIMSGNTKLIATSDPPALHEIRGRGGADAVWTSKVLDAGLHARFGRLVWHANGVIELSTRTGNTESPGKSWSEWSAPLAAPGKITSPAARYVQVRARFDRDPNAELSQITIPFVTDNVRPVVTSIDVPGTRSSKEKEGIPASGGEPPAHSSNLKITWKVDNADSDPLRYRLFYRREGETTWRPLNRPDESVTKAEYEWNTANLPEGPYRVRVEASDENANPPDRTKKHALDSAVVLVDNTPPVFRALSANGRRITADVVDGVGPIARLDIAVDGLPEWHPYEPTDGIFDEPVEQFSFDVSPFASAGPHLVAVRAFDQAGNFVVRSVELK